MSVAQLPSGEASMAVPPQACNTERPSSGVLAILQHALGRDEHGRSPHPVGKPVNDPDYRNHYCTGEGSADLALCREAVAQGLMVEHAPSEISGGDFIFTVTAAGKAFIAEHSPAPPKVSRGKARYLRWLEVSDAYDVSFGDWLRAGGA